MANLNDIFQMDKKTNQIGVYNLTPVEAFLINKNLPFGTKLVLENELKRKFISKKRKSPNKKKGSNISKEKKLKDSKNMSYSRNSKIKKIHLKLIYKGKSHENPIFMNKCKCLMFLFKISSQFELEPLLIYNKPSIRDIERDVIKCKYDSFYQFKLSIRNFWLYHYKNEGSKKLIPQIKKLCSFSEKTFENIENLKEDFLLQKYKLLSIDENSSLFQVKTLSSNLTVESNPGINIISEGKNSISPKNNNKENNSNTTNESILNEEKNILCEKIKFLTPSQLQGIIPLLSDFFNKVDNVNDQYVEFDIELLNKEQTQKVEIYVNKCIESNKNSNIKNQYNNNVFKIEEEGKKRKKLLLETISSSGSNKNKTFNNIYDDNTNNIEKNNLNFNQLNFDNIDNSKNYNENNYESNIENSNFNNLLFTENSFLNQALDQSKIENTTLFNPLNISDRNISNQNISLDYINKSPHNTSQLNFDESFDFH